MEQRAQRDDRLMIRKMNISKHCKTASKAYPAAGGSSAALVMRLSKAAAALLVLTLIILMTAASAISVFAEGENGENNGADAHSGSMSAGSGQNPIADESTTWDYGQDEEDAFADEESEDAEVLYYDEEFEEDEAAADDEIMEEDEADVPADDLTKRLVMVLICSVIVLAGAVAAILAVMRMEKRSQ